MERIGIYLLFLQMIILFLMLYVVGSVRKKSKETEQEQITLALLQRLEESIQLGLSSNRMELNQKLTSVEELVSTRMLAMGKGQQELLNEMMMQSKEDSYRLYQRMDAQLGQMHEIMHQRLVEIGSDNQKKLEQMRITVDEKLHHTLESRLGESFKLVNDRLEQVYTGLGEMKSLASDVGDLKKVLSNVKTRGILGEVQLEAILVEVLSSEQYAKNVKPIPTSKEIVEFALILPGKEKKGRIYLPMDAKFPLEAYRRLLEAYENGDRAEIEKQGKELQMALRKNAMDIHHKYIHPPYTTDFAIMFLPMEGLYAEVVRRSDLLEEIQRKWKIIIAGPSTFSALLNSLQMGFRTLAIEQQTAEVWNVLAQVKHEFQKFGGVLEKTQQKLSEAGSDLDKLVGVRSRQILKQLDRAAILENEKAPQLDNENQEAE